MSQFDLEEILPDAAMEPVRLPRRQAGSSPQGLAVTLLADYSLRNRAWLPSAAIVALLVESGVTTAGARTAISRLARRGVLESSRQGRNTFYRLTSPAATALASGGREIVAFCAEADSWDDHWTLIAFSLPQEGDAQRRALRARLRWLGFAPLYDALWVSAYTQPARVAAKLAEVRHGATTVFTARHVELDATISRNPLDAWDLTGIAGHYETFIRRWQTFPPGNRAGGLTGAEALRARTEVMDAYRQFVVLDPRLPMRLMPAGWPRERAREVFEAVYDGLAEPALDHLLRTVDRFADDPQPDIAAHTVADLRAGLRPGAHPLEATTTRR